MASALSSNFAIVERFITSSDGTAVFAQAAGNSRLPTLVFIHGMALSTLVWARILQDVNLLTFFHLVAYDMRGHGRSGKPDTAEGYTSELYAQDFAAVLKAFDITSPILVGWSLGGIIAADVTAHIGPDALAGIVLTAAVPWASAYGMVATEWVRGLQLSNTEDADISIASRIKFNTNLFNHPEKVPADVLWSWIGSSCLQPPSKLNLVASRTQDTTNLFKAGAEGVPVLIVNGGADRFMEGNKAVEIVKEQFRNVTVHTSASGSHAFFYEEQEEYVRELSRFAKRVFADRLK